MQRGSSFWRRGPSSREGISQSPSPTSTSTRACTVLISSSISLWSRRMNVSHCKHCHLAAAHFVCRAKGSAQV